MIHARAISVFLRSMLLLAILTASALTAAYASASEKGGVESSMPAAGRETKIPDFLIQLDAQERFEQCVTAAFKAGDIGENDALEAVIAKGKVAPLYADLQKDWTLQSLREMGIDPEADLDDRGRLKAVTAAIARPVDDLAFAMTGPRLSARLRIAQIEALGITSCEVPAHLLPGGDPERDWMMANTALLDEMTGFTNAFVECVDDEMAEDESIDRESLSKAIPADVQAAIRAHVVSSLSADGLLQDGDREGIESARTIDEVFVVYKLLMGTAMDMRHIGKMVLYDKYYQNRYLKLGCDFKPSARLREHLGLPEEH
ncbi:hypothetical protein [Lysobacter hankyongensis]|uniref:DUF2066 domain-containing protein n=1 Tax=Lysobacter hankyongensis TaxID=1176535 RepID=A0ABP9C7T9_9GAMM